ELVHRRSFATCEEAHTAVFGWIEVWDNPNVVTRYWGVSVRKRSSDTINNSRSRWLLNSLSLNMEEDHARRSRSKQPSTMGALLLPLGDDITTLRQPHSGTQNRPQEMARNAPIA